MALLASWCPPALPLTKPPLGFFKGVSTAGRLKALYDFENKKVFFPDVYASFKFCIFVASPQPFAAPAQCAFYLHKVAELADPNRRFALSAEDFARINPNTGTAPIFRTRRDADLTTAIYKRLPILVGRSSGKEVKAWPVKYSTMFHMTNDSGLFRTRVELDEQEGAYPTGGNVFGSPSGNWLPLYVGRMIHQFDHRAASVKVNEANLHNAALSGTVTDEQKSDPSFVPISQFWVPESEINLPDSFDWILFFRDIARATDARTIITSATPKAGFGNKAPLLFPTDNDEYRQYGYLMLANMNAIVMDFVARAKVHSTSINWFIVEQLPVIPPAQFEQTKFGPKSAAEIIRAAVLELTYTAHDMAPFARDMGYVDDSGEVKPPFIWDAERRLALRAKLDAMFFLLYGITDRDDVRYIYSTFPIVEREEIAAHGCFRSRDLCLAYMNALNAGNPDAEVVL